MTVGPNAVLSEPAARLGIEDETNTLNQKEGTMSQLAAKIERKLLFADNHPELAPYLSELEGTYSRCQGELPPDLADVYDHYRTCAWCRTEFDHLKGLKDTFRRR